MHGVLAFSSTIIGFPCFPFDLPFALLGGPLGPSLGFGALLQQLQRLWQEKLFLGQLESLLSAYLPSFDCGGIAQWIEHSRLRVLQPKTLATSPKGSWTHVWRNHLETFLISSITLSKRRTVRSLWERNSPSILWLGHCSLGIWFKTFIRLDENSCKSARTLLRPKCREIIWITARPCGAWLWRVQLSMRPWTLNCNSGTLFRPLMSSEASHLSSHGTRPQELEHSSAESTLKAIAIQVVAWSIPLMSRRPNIRIRVFFQTLKSAALLGNGSNFALWRARLSTRSLSVFSSTTNSSPSPPSSSGQSPSSGGGSRGPSGMIEPEGWGERLLLLGFTGLESVTFCS